MATLPATTSPAEALTQAPVLALPGADFLRGAMRLPITRQIVLLVAICASVALGAASVLWMRSAEYRQLIELDNPAVAAEVTAALDATGIKYVIDERAGLLVAEQDYHRARLQLAGTSASQAGPLGYELLDREQGFGQSQMMEAVQYRRGLEGELARSIQALAAVQQARVLIAQPQQSAFLRNRQKPSASVSLTLMPGRSLSADQIRAITSLVAGAVPELTPQEVSVVDQAARLLTAQDDEDDLTQTLKELDYIERIESKLQRNVYNQLVRSLGPTGFSTEVVAEVDFTRSEEAAEVYKPEATSVRSESTVEEEETGERNIAAGIPGALSNEPAVTAPDAEEETTDPKRRKAEITRNYEVDRTVSYTRRPGAALQRLSVSVVINDRAPLPPAAEGEEPVPNPWTADELAGFESLVRAAIGYSAERGDTVTIINQPFIQMPAFDSPNPAFWEQSWFSSLLKQALGGLALLLLIVGLLRPLVRNVSQAGVVLKEQQALTLARMAEEQATAQAQGAALADDREGQARLPGQNMGLLPTTPELGSKLESIRNMVNEDPERAAQVVKHWVGRDE